MNQVKLIQMGNDLPLTPSVETAEILFAETLLTTTQGEIL